MRNIILISLFIISSLYAFISSSVMAKADIYHKNNMLVERNFVFLIICFFGICYYFGIIPAIFIYSIELITIRKLKLRISKDLAANKHMLPGIFFVWGILLIIIDNI